MLPIAGGALTASVGLGLRVRDIRGLRACSVSGLFRDIRGFVRDISGLGPLVFITACLGFAALTALRLTVMRS